MSDTLITKRQVEIESFNAEWIDISNLGNFMKYYLAILQIAFNYSMISQKQRDVVASLILEAIELKGKAIVASNYIYAITVVCSKMPNYQVLEMMKDISSIDDAQKFVENIENLFKERISKILKLTNLGLNMAVKLKDSDILKTWAKIKQDVNDIYGCFEPGTKTELKKMHSNMHFPLFLYQLIKHEVGESIIDSSENAVSNFLIETQIMLKIDAEHLIPKIRKAREEQEAVLPESEKEKDVIRRIKVMQDKKNGVQKRYEFYKEKVRKSENIIESMNAEFDEYEKKHPGMSQRESDKVFDKIAKKWESHKDYFAHDLIEVQEKFEPKLSEIDCKIRELEEELDRIRDEISLAECAVTQTIQITLSEIIIELNLIYLAQDGVIQYPESLLQKQNILAHIPFENAVKNFVSKNQGNLTQKEGSYLLS